MISRANFKISKLEKVEVIYLLYHYDNLNSAVYIFVNSSTFYFISALLNHEMLFTKLIICKIYLLSKFPKVLPDDFIQK